MTQVLTTLLGIASVLRGGMIRAADSVLGYRRMADFATTVPVSAWTGLTAERVS